MHSESFNDVILEAERDMTSLRAVAHPGQTLSFSNSVWDISRGREVLIKLQSPPPSGG